MGAQDRTGRNDSKNFGQRPTAPVEQARLVQDRLNAG